MTSESTAQADPLRVYRAACLECHDNDGRGEIIRDLFPKVPDFTDADWHASRSDAELARSILEGKGKSMPKMRSKLGSVDVMRMVAFVRSFRGGTLVVEDEPDPAPMPEVPGRPGPASVPGAKPHRVAVPPARNKPSLGEANRAFQRLCQRCHGADGKGGPMRETFPAMPDFTSPTWHKRRSDSRLVVSVLDGKGDGMPAFRGKLSSQQARDLVAFIRGFGPGQPSVAGAAPDHFEARFRQLQQECKELGRQIRELSRPAAQP